MELTPGSRSSGMSALVNYMSDTDSLAEVVTSLVQSPTAQFVARQAARAGNRVARIALDHVFHPYSRPMGPMGMPLNDFVVAKSSRHGRQGRQGRRIIVLTERSASAKSGYKRMFWLKYPRQKK